MPDYKTHNNTGLIAGVILGLANISTENNPSKTIDIVAEALGCILGCKFGSTIPDILEPALDSWHRSTFHSYTLGTTMVLSAPRLVESWRNYCLQQVEIHEYSAHVYQGCYGIGNQHYMMALIWRVFRGLAPGIITGYISHLALDSVTPRGLPLI